MKSSFRVSINKTDRQHLQLTGVPKGLLKPFSIRVSKYLNPQDFSTPNNPFAISVQQQLRWLNYFGKHTPLVPTKLLFCTEHYYEQARTSALILFLQYYYAADAKNMPEWHIMRNYYKNTFLDEWYDNKHRSESLLVLDNLHTDMPQLMQSQAADTIHHITDRPLLLILRGPDSLAYCIKKLGCRPKALIKFDRRNYLRI